MIAWSLVWLCQGAVLTLVALATSRLVPRLNAATRYAIWWSTLVLIAVTGVWTFPLAPASSAMAVGGPGGGSGHLLVVPSAPRALVSIVVGIWAAIALIKLVKLVAAIHSIYVLRDSSTPIPAAIEAALPLWNELRIRGRTARLMICDRVPGATVLGFFDPYIAIPGFLTAALKPEELDLVILHERAHVQRRDDWLKLAQELVLAPLWIHPAAAFVSRHLGREREMACDESVVARTAEPKTYARCLTRAAEAQRSRPRFVAASQPLLGPTLLVKHIEVLGRIDRLLAFRGPVRRRLSTLPLSSVVCTMVSMSALLGTIPLIAELGEVLLPQVTAPAARLGAGLSRVTPQAAGLAQTSPSPRDPVHGRQTAAHAPSNMPPAPGERDERSTAPLEMNGADAEPMLLVSKAYEQRHSGVPTAGVLRIVRAMTPWQKTSDASVRFAEGLTRAGTSLARRF